MFGWLGTEIELHKGVSGMEVEVACNGLDEAEVPGNTNSGRDAEGGVNDGKKAGASTIGLPVIVGINLGC